MGGPKALMDVRGRPWWRRQHEAITAMDLEATWVVSPEVDGAMADHADAPQRRARSSPDAPMFQSILAGVESLADSPPVGVFILPVDVPAPGAGVWRALEATGRVAVPRCAGRGGNPVFLPWSWVRASILGRAAGDGPRLDHLIAPDAMYVDVDDPSVVANLNRPEDVAAWLAR